MRTVEIARNRLSRFEQGPEENAAPVPEPRSIAQEEAKPPSQALQPTAAAMSVCQRGDGSE
jgi:hypothetical protein